MDKFFFLKLTIEDGWPRIVLVCRSLGLCGQFAQRNSLDSAVRCPEITPVQGIAKMHLNQTKPVAEVISDPSLMGGEPVVRGTRIPAATIAAYLAAGRTDREVFEDYPSLPVGGVESVRRWTSSTASRD
jgi:uncharacterized protein (DUF433 family)